MLTVAEARARGVCRICSQQAPTGWSDWGGRLRELWIDQGTDGHIKYVLFFIYGREFAHAACLEKLTDAPPEGPLG